MEDLPLACECVFSVISFLVNSQETFLISATIHSSEEVINSIFLKKNSCQAFMFSKLLIVMASI